jgi:hypothetical protein
MTPQAKAKPDAKRSTTDYSTGSTAPALDKHHPHKVGIFAAALRSAHRATRVRLSNDDWVD